MKNLTLITPTDLEQSFDVTADFVEKMADKAAELVISGIDDRQGYITVNDARKIIKEKRVAVEKKRVELNADALAYQRTVNTEAKRITALLEPIESQLEAKIKAIDTEKERLKQEAIRLKQEKTAERIGQLAKMEMTQISGMYYVAEQRVSHSEVETWEDEIWMDFLNICQREYAEIQRIKSETEAAAKAESERLAAEQQAERLRLEAAAKELQRIQQEQKAEADRLKKIAQQQADEAARLAAEQEVEKKRLQEEKENLEKIAQQQAEEAARLKQLAQEQETKHLPLVQDAHILGVNTPTAAAIAIATTTQNEALRAAEKQKIAKAICFALGATGERDQCPDLQSAIQLFYDNNCTCDPYELLHIFVCNCSIEEFAEIKEAIDKL